MIKVTSINQPWRLARVGLVALAIIILASCVTSSQEKPEQSISEVQVSALFEAIRDADLRTVSDLVTRAPRLLVTTDADGDLPLTAALWAEQLPIAEWLLDHGSAVNAQNDLGFSALMIAAQSGSEASTGLLLARGALVDQRNLHDKMRTPLIYAVLGAHLAVATRLIDAGADLDLTDDEGLAAVNWAAYSSDLPVLRLLVERGANLAIIDGYGDGLLANALHGGRVENQEYLAKVFAEKR